MSHMARFTPILFWSAYTAATVFTCSLVNTRAETNHTASIQWLD